MQLPWRQCNHSLSNNVILKQELRNSFHCLFSSVNLFDCRSWLGFGSLWCLCTVYGHEITHFQQQHFPESEHLTSDLHETSQGALAARPFLAFSPHVHTYSDQEFLFVESNSMPLHPLMVGITAWQQQVPLPQPYVGDNAWRIPLYPVPAKKPISAKSQFFRGAIALAANGVPIFNPIKNDGRTDTFLAGELDDYGGHSGRADDYHYHISPLHLQEILGESLPVAYALDGYPIYGLNEPDGSEVGELDAFNGHYGPKGDYHYHSSNTYPYLNGGFHGEVEERGGQVHPQPRVHGVRPYTQPLRGATITDWNQPEENQYSVEYTIGKEVRYVNYTLLEGGKVRFQFVDAKGNTTEKTFSPEERNQRRIDRNRENRPPGRTGDRAENNLSPFSQDLGTLPPTGQQAGSGKPHPVLPFQPNFILILIDDMGWKDMGFSGGDFIDTPHTDHLARQGVIFNQAYSSAPNCAPTRACLMSGQYTPRHGVFTVVDARHEPGLPHHKIVSAHSSAELPSDSITIAEALKNGGYRTAMFGMWNLGRGRSGPHTPTGQGFDVFKQPRDLGFAKDAYFNDSGKYLTDALTSEGIRFLENMRQRPFFLYLAYHAVHHPFEPKPELLNKYREKARNNAERRNAEFAATAEALDQNVGRIEDALQRLGLKDKTIVVFTSDNGGNRQNVAPLNGGKGTLYEGGIRVPAAVWGAGIRKSFTSSSPILSMDIYPTLLELAGLSQPGGHHLDGVSFASLLLGGDEPDRDMVFWHFPSYIGAGGPSSALRKGNYKLIENFESRALELYDLSTDVGESHNLAESRPGLTETLYNELLGWHKATDAPRPTELNPNYDPDARPIRGRENRGKGGDRGNRQIQRTQGR